jgi:hypothetical protein
VSAPVQTSHAASPWASMSIVDVGTTSDIGSAAGAGARARVFLSKGTRVVGIRFGFEAAIPLGVARPPPRRVREGKEGRESHGNIVSGLPERAEATADVCVARCPASERVVGGALGVGARQARLVREPAVIFWSSTLGHGVYGPSCLSPKGQGRRDDTVSRRRGRRASAVAVVVVTLGAKPNLGHFAQQACTALCADG